MLKSLEIIDKLFYSVTFDIKREKNQCLILYGMLKICAFLKMTNKLFKCVAAESRAVCDEICLCFQKCTAIKLLSIT